METNTNKAADFNNQWVRLVSGQYRHPAGWGITNTRQGWVAHRGLIGECEMPKGWDKETVFSTLLDAKRAINQFNHDKRKALAL